MWRDRLLPGLAAWLAAAAPAQAYVAYVSNEKGNTVSVIDTDNWILYELFAAYPRTTGWKAGSGAVFDLNSNALRPAGWTSADAAGLPIFPGLVRYDEVVEQGVINHALRFTVSQTRHGYVDPARHFASDYTSPNLPPMGMRVRLKAVPASEMPGAHSLRMIGKVIGHTPFPRARQNRTARLKGRTR